MQGLMPLGESLEETNENQSDRGGFHTSNDHAFFLP
jgi:hypothetical protein